MKKILSIFIVLLIGIVAFCGCNETRVDEKNNNKGGENINVNGQGAPPRQLYFSTVKEIEDFVALKDCTEAEYQAFLSKDENYLYDWNGMSTPEDVAVFAQNIENGGYPRFTNEEQTFALTYYPDKEKYTFDYYVNDIRYRFNFFKNSIGGEIVDKIFVGQQYIGNEKVDIYKGEESFYARINRNDYLIEVWIRTSQYEDIDFSTVIF